MRVVLLALVLASTLNFSHAGFFGDKIIDKVQDAVQSRLGFELPQQLKDAYQLVNTTQSDEDQSCRKCVKKVSHHIIGATIDEIKSYCANTTCPKIQEHCDWMAEHKNFTLGYLVQKIRPIQQSYLYCAGKGRCEVHPGQSNELVQDVLGQTAVDQQSAIVHANILEALTEAQAKASHKEKDSDVQIHHKKHHKKHHRKEIVKDDDECHECLKETSHAFLKHIFKGLKEFCDKTECEKMQRACEFTFSHMGFSAGYLSAKYQPYNFAAGYCWGNESCECDSAVQYQPIDKFSSSEFSL